MADFTSRFNDLLARYTGSDTDLANALGVSKQTISAWKKGSRFPKKPVIRIIAAHFNVGVPWLTGITNDEHETGIEIISNEYVSDTSGSARPVKAKSDPNEDELISIYRSLNSFGQQTLIGTARGLAANPDMKKGGKSKDVTA